MGGIFYDVGQLAQLMLVEYIAHTQQFDKTTLGCIVLLMLSSAYGLTRKGLILLGHRRFVEAEKHACADSGIIKMSVEPRVTHSMIPSRDHSFVSIDSALTHDYDTEATHTISSLHLDSGLSDANSSVDSTRRARRDSSSSITS